MRNLEPHPISSTELHFLLISAIIYVNTWKTKASRPDQNPRQVDDVIQVRGDFYFAPTVPLKAIASDPHSAEVRFIEVKGRAGVGEVALSANEYKTAERLRADYWLYVVYNCGRAPEVHAIQDPIRLNWQPVVQVEHYHVAADQIINRELS